MRRATAATAACGALLLLAFLAPSGAIAADVEEPGEIRVTVPERGPSEGDVIDDAQFRWGLNAESGAGAYAGGCNFLSAGRAGDTGRGGVVWTEQHGLYRSVAGDVRIEKPNFAGEYDLATWANRCLDPAGNAVSAASVTSTSGNQVVIDGGRGVRADDGSIEIRWSGAFTVVFYGGMTYWSASDPVLTLDARGNGRVTATASGFGASMEDLSKWEALPERQIVLAEVRGAATGSSGGFATEPLYIGVEVSGVGQVARDAANSAYWGSFPASFVEYQKLTGQAGYWVTTGGLRDRAKPASTLYISYDAAAPIAVTPPAAASGADPAPSNAIRTRPVAASAPAPAIAPGVPVFPLADTATLLPQGEALIPGAAAFGANPVVLPLLGTAAALSLAILAVLNLMQAFPWQRPGT
ncbi:hypothetical protein [Microbacterium sp. SLBN-146]|uniref:hypothetical protein n=1 Tax=Microbacterium sp. SLBN-146 TaxID=2768457 RepID=UPI00114E5B54|nr:hypothetical protein [Microbacterium sp. SLBN-146]TQJ30515.1 hypothetical protein FBY39_0967 [Microbacterium sp. SLBN-146]